MVVLLGEYLNFDRQVNVLTLFVRIQTEALSDGAFANIVTQVDVPQADTLPFALTLLIISSVELDLQLEHLLLVAFLALLVTRVRELTAPLEVTLLQPA